MELEGNLRHAVRRDFALWSVIGPEASVTVLSRFGGLEVLELELNPGAELTDPMLWSGLSWHLVMEGEAVFQCRDERWALLPQQSLYFEEAIPFSLANQSPGKLKILTLVFRSDSDGAKE